MGERIAFEQARLGQASTLAAVADAVAGQLRPVVTGLHRRPDHVALVGIGASHAAAASGVQGLLSRGISVSRHLPSERPLDAPWPQDTLVVAISQSGRSPETFELVSRLRGRPGVTTLALTNAPDGPVQQAADLHLHLAGQCDSFASTIGWTGTVLALDLLAAALAGEESSFAALFDALPGLLADRAALDPVLDALADSTSVDLVGSCHGLASAEAGALLLREVARMPASAAETRNYLHGAMECAGDTTHLFFGEGRELGAAREIGQAGHHAVVVGSMPVGAPVIGVPLPPLDGAAAAIAQGIVAQGLAAGLAERRGLDIEEFVFLADDTKIGQVAPPLERTGA